MNGFCIVALPLGDNKVEYNDGDIAPVHQTLVYLGNAQNFDERTFYEVKLEVQELARLLPVISAKVCGRATLGPDAEKVILTESAELTSIRNALVSFSPIADALARTTQYPNWISHLAGMNHLMYGDYVTFNRLAVWFGPSFAEFPLGTRSVIVDDMRRAPEFGPV